MKRQIIKTRPQRPYIIARITIVAVVVIIILVAIAYAIAERRARTHDVTQAPSQRTAGQDLTVARGIFQVPTIISS